MLPLPKRIVIIGPESTGKSTLCAALSKKTGEPWVPEYARQYIEELERPYRFEDLLEIAKGQVRLEDKMANKASKLLFCDTDLHVIKIWSDHKYGHTHPWIEEEISRRKYDLYLLKDIDLPWEADPQREYPDPAMRKFFYNWLERLLKNTGVPVIKISGHWEERIQKAYHAIQEIME